MNQYLSTFIASILIINCIYIILPKGKMSDIIKYVLSFILLMIMLKPIVNLNIDFIDTKNSYTFNYNENILDFYFESRIDIIKKNCEEILSKNGINDCTTQIEYIVNDLSDFSIDKIIFNIDKKIDDEMKLKIIKDIKEYLGIENIKIDFYE